MLSDHFALLNVDLEECMEMHFSKFFPFVDVHKRWLSKNRCPE